MQQKVRDKLFIQNPDLQNISHKHSANNNIDVNNETIGDVNGKASPS